MTHIVFSKDRAMQLDAFLRSFARNVGERPVSVLYTSSSTKHEEAYRDVFAAHPWAVPRLQGRHFDVDLLLLIPRGVQVILYADDHVFTRPWAEEEKVNLHLGLHLSHCYTTNTRQSVPPFELVEPDKITWWWSEGKGDWGYPLALCGQTFLSDELREMMLDSSFYSPNSLEAALQRFKPMFTQRRGVCYRESKLVLLPWNLVQTDCPNRHESMPTVEEMLGFWRNGYRINVESMYGVVNESVHQPLPLVLETR